MMQSTPPPVGGSADESQSLLPPPTETGGRDALLAFVDVTFRNRSQAGTKVKCKSCGKEFAGLTGRIVGHFAIGSAHHGVTNCPNPPAEAVALAKPMSEDIQKKRGQMSEDTQKKRKAGAFAGAESTTTTTTTPDAREKNGKINDGKQKGGKQKDAKQQDGKRKKCVWKVQDGSGKAAADAAHARLVFSSGQSFDLGRNPFFLEVLEQAIKNPTWRPNGREAVGSTDLEREYEKVEASSKQNIRDLGPEKFGKAITVDRWTGKDNIPRVNIIESVCGTGRFLDAIDCTGELECISSLAGLLTPHMSPFVDLVVADEACGGVLGILEAKCPRLTGMKCAARAIDLLLKDIAKADWAACIIKRNNEVVSFIKDHQKASALYATKTKRKLITPCTTRFVTNVISASRTLQNKVALRSFANDPGLEEYLWDATPDVRATGKRVKRELLSSDDRLGDFWFELSFLMETSYPSLTLLRMADGIEPCMSKFFYGFLTLPDKWDGICREKAAACGSPGAGEGWAGPDVLARLDVMKEKCQVQREAAWCPMMSAAFATDPEFIRPSIHLESIDNGRVLMDLNTMYERLLIEYEPGEDSAAATVRVADAAAEPDGGPVGRAQTAMSLFRRKHWQGAMYLGAAKNMPVAEWWDCYGCAGMEELAKVAMRCNSKIPASAGPERSRSLYGDDEGGRLGAMGPEKARKVVFMRANLKLQTETFSRRPFVAWDPESVESDGFLASGDDILDSDSDSDINSL